MMIVGLLEFYRLAASQEIYPQQVLGFIVGAVIYIILALIALGILSALYLALLPVLLLLFFIAELYRTKPNSLLNITFSIFPIA